MQSSLPLMFAYTVIAFVLQALAIGVIIVIEPLLNGWSGVVFMASYLLTFWLAWVIAVRLTEPKPAKAPDAQATRA
ncbi:hypothetical protein [Pseudorhodoplanes sp.]|uniref:hypothetical protein n=1 Tax=Pseudorhodoplanes sp. TaxID=1934341 RepID=UPI002C545B2B|nr:hypothetical protein [Pseudorhodoplanes sp.]HWV53959.1 hypothetical protein [Pseudorhodoplanes sp.]